LGLQNDQNAPRAWRFAGDSLARPADFSAIRHMPENRQEISDDQAGARAKTRGAGRPWQHVADSRWQSVN